MNASPSETVLHWARRTIGDGARIMGLKSLHGDQSPWLLQIAHDGHTHEVVLRLPVAGRIDARGILANAAALVVAEEHELAAPRLIAWDPTGDDAGTVATLEAVLPGVSDLPGKVEAARLRDAGAAIARVHAISLEPQRYLPLRTRPIQVDDYARDRRWAMLWQASSSQDQAGVVDAFSAFTGMPEAKVPSVLSQTHSTPLLHLADEQVRAYGVPDEPTVLVHGDIWPGNMRWVGETCTALIDWKTAGVGNPGVDFGSLRLQIALRYGMEAPASVLEGWEQQMGRAATHVAYWDAVAALNTPTEMEGWPGFDALGNPASTAVVCGRRDAFLREALKEIRHKESG